MRLELPARPVAARTLEDMPIRGMWAGWPTLPDPAVVAAGLGRVPGDTRVDRRPDLQPIDRYLRDHVLRPLAMEHADVARSERVRGDLATGYAPGSKGLQPVRFREVPLIAAGGVYSTTSDLSRYVAALLSGGSGERARPTTASASSCSPTPGVSTAGALHSPLGSRCCAD